MKSVLLVGCGNIGFRHLQALRAMSADAWICVVEPNGQLHDRIRRELAVGGSDGEKIEVFNSLPDEPRRFDLAVVATTAVGRRHIIEEVLRRYDVGAMILEKVLFQRVEDLDVVADLFQKRMVDAYVNCGRRSFPGYAEIRELTESAPLSLTVLGHDIGLASNAVHFLDLGEYLSGSELTAVDLGGLAAGFADNKRAGCVEIFGTVEATFANGASLSVTSLDEKVPRLEVIIANGSEVIRIDEVARTVRVNDVAAAPFASQNVSESPHIYETLLDVGSCVLTAYADSVRQHRLYLVALREHLGLSNVRDEPCPIS